MDEIGWFKVDDKLHDHHKSRKAGKSAMGVWVLAGSWSRDNETDGFIPEGVLLRWGTRADAKRLTDADLWIPGEKDGEAGWWFHDWARFQPGATVTAATKAKESEAGARGNHRRWHVDRGVAVTDCEYCHHGPDEPPDESDRVAIGSPDRVPDATANRVSIAPLPLPLPDTQSATQIARRDDPDGPPRNAGTMLGEWIDSLPQRPPSRMIGHLSREIKAMLDEGQPYDDVRNGLIAWSGKGLASPSTLASVVHEVRTPRKPASKTNGVDWDAALQRAAERDRNHQ